MRDEERITREQTRKEREFGPYWYSALWKLVRPFLVWCCAGLLALGILTSAWRSVRHRYFDAADAGNSEAVPFTVSSGSSLSRVAGDLEAAGLIANHSVFRYYADLLGYSQKIQAGDYLLNRSMDMQTILDTLTTGDGKPLVRWITVIPGWTVENIAAYLQKEGVIASEEDFLSLCRDGTRYASYYYIQDILSAGKAQARRYALEGYLAPDSYEIYTSASADDVIRKLLSQTGSVFSDGDFDRLEALNGKLRLQLTMDDIVILASMVEKEAGAEDFAKVAAVFYNRLKAGMTLSSDATVKYVTGVTRLALTESDTAVASPYNTYQNRGLPAGPICCPSPAAIHAALEPEESFMKAGQEYLYFCTKEPESGQLQFSRTYEEHQQAVRLYRPLWEAYDQKQRNLNTMQQDHHENE